MPRPQIIIDTNVFVAALRSSQGASFRLLSLVDRKKFGVHISVPLVLEYEHAAKRIAAEIGLTFADIDDIIDYLCRVAQHHQIQFLWRPCLRDPDDDLVLEIAVEASCDFIVTHNVRDFTGAEQFGIRVIRPQEFLNVVRVLP
jgi:putative PIN family toxin of toxin-antitoxin system